MNNPKPYGSTKPAVIEVDINLDTQPHEIQALGILAISGQHLNKLFTLQGRIAQLMSQGHVLPENAAELHTLFVQAAFQLSKIADFNSLMGCRILEEAYDARHPIEQGIAELRAHREAGRALS